MRKNQDNGNEYYGKGFGIIGFGGIEPEVVAAEQFGQRERRGEFAEFGLVSDIQ